MAIQSRGSSTYGTSTLEIEGAPMGALLSFEGGNETADVITEALASVRIQKKHLGNVRPEEIVITFGDSMDKAVFDWIGSTLKGDIVRKSGAVTLLDLNNTPISRFDFLNALITEIGFPALDTASKGLGRFTLKFAPESTSLNRKPYSGKAAATKKQSNWLLSNFRLTIDGVDCTSINTIGVLTVKQTVQQTAIGQIREAIQTSPSLEFPNLVVTLSDSKADQFYNWYEDFVIKGNNSDSQEKSGSLQYLSPDLKTTLFTLNFSHLGIFSLAQATAASSTETVQRVVAGMYCEQITLGLGQQALTGTQSTGQTLGSSVPLTTTVLAATTAVASGLLPVQPCNPQPSQPAINLRSLKGARVAPTLRFRS